MTKPRAVALNLACLCEQGGSVDDLARDAVFLHLVQEFIAVYTHTVRLANQDQPKHDGSEQARQEKQNDPEARTPSQDNQLLQVLELGVYQPDLFRRNVGRM
jgi:hypothetical protein